MACQSKWKENKFHNLQPFQPTAESALETKWANTTSGRYTYIPRHHPGSKTYQEKPAQEETSQSKEKACLDEVSVMHREGRWSQCVEKALWWENPPSGMAASSTAAKSNSSMLSREQHPAMKMMTGVMQSTPIFAMEMVTGLQPIEDRQEIKLLTQAAKFKRLQDHPIHERQQGGD